MIGTTLLELSSELVNQRHKFFKLPGDHNSILLLTNLNTLLIQTWLQIVFGHVSISEDKVFYFEIIKNLFDSKHNYPSSLLHFSAKFQIIIR